VHRANNVATAESPRQGATSRPYLRGYGSTYFLSRDTQRNEQQSVIALDAMALMDALQVERAIVAGFDWGARTANIMAALWPDRCKALVSVSGYLIGNQAAGSSTVGPSVGPVSAYPTLSTPASICFKEANELVACVVVMYCPFPSAET
jgi:pimeloyl-ACP methyl ester carboxylesterase